MVGQHHEVSQVVNSGAMRLIPKWLIFQEKTSCLDLVGFGGGVAMDSQTGLPVGLAPTTSVITNSTLPDTSARHLGLCDHVSESAPGIGHGLMPGFGELEPRHGVGDHATAA